MGRRLDACKKSAAQPQIWRHVHLVLTAAWFVAIIPTVLWWKSSILWVALMSCWANAAGHFSAWQATRVEEQQEKDEKQRQEDRKEDSESG